MPDFNPRRQWLDEYIARPNLWPGQIDALRVLAAQLGVEIQLYRFDLNTPAAGWQLIQNPSPPGEGQG